MAKRIYVLDTNVLLHDPKALTKFDNRDVVIPMTVISELDNKKNGVGEVAYNARETFRIIKELREKGDIWKGVDNGCGGMISIKSVPTNFIQEHSVTGVDPQKPDVMIVMTALYIKESAKKGSEVTLVSNDTGIQIIADLFDLRTEYYRNDRVKDENLAYTGRQKLHVITNDGVWDSRSILEMYISEEEMYKYFSDEEISLTENEYVEMIHPNGVIELGRYSEGRILPLRLRNTKPYGVTPRNAGQAFLLDALLMPASELPLVIVRSTAGSGKTFLTLAAALQKTIREDIYQYIVYTRANVEFDRDIGALPGTENEKMAPLVRPALDNLELLNRDQEDMSRKDGMPLPSITEDLIENGIIRTEAMSFMRGRSIANAFLFVDEAQNCSIGQVTGIVTRPGIGTKVVLAGDPDQIDNRYLDKYNNGLSFLADKFKGEKLAAQVTLFPEECTRSPLASVAGKLLSGTSTK